MCLNSKQIEYQNQQKIIACIEKGNITRADVAKRTGLSRTTVSTAINYLMNLQLVHEIPMDEDATLGKGRPGIPLALTEGRWYAAGATLIDSEVHFVVLNLNGSVVRTLTLTLADDSAQTYLDTLVNGFRILMLEYGERLLPMLGIGSPGMINDGQIVMASDMGWDHVDIAGHLQNALHLPSTVINRHWASCICEYRAGQAGSMIYVGISTGIAAAIIVDGQLFTGAYHNAGEIGHTVVKPGGPRCTCGRCGCLHAVSSEVFIIQHILDYYTSHPRPLVSDDPLWETVSSGRKLTIIDICAAARNYHPLAVSELKESATYLGLSISNLTGMFDPECVVLGGSLIEHGGADFTRWIIESVRMNSNADTLRSVKFSPWTQGIISGAVGAAQLVLDRKIELAAQR